MLRQQFIQEIMASNLMIHQSGCDTLSQIINAINHGTFKPESIEHTITSTRGEIYLDQDENGSYTNPFDGWQEGSIAIIPLVGIMMKYGYWWTYGVDDIAEIIRLAYDSDKIAGVIIKADTPGGAVDSLYLIEEVLRQKAKPTFGYVDGMCTSCGYITFSYLDKIYAINRMAHVGGIGVFQRLLIPNNDKAYYKVVDVYPDESKDKNLPEREAAQGNEEKMKEELSKLAQYFQNTVKENRPKIDEETLTGKTYYAYEAESIGMIDGIRTLSQVIDEMSTIISNRQSILSTF